jgi:hypothetical protein
MLLIFMVYSKSSTNHDNLHVATLGDSIRMRTVNGRTNYLDKRIGGAIVATKHLLLIPHEPIPLTANQYRLPTRLDSDNAHFISPFVSLLTLPKQ